MILEQPPIVLAAVAHPDDIEFYFAGTLLLLQQSGCSIHMWNVSDGCCGTMRYTAKEIAEIRAREAKASATIAEAQLHAPLFHDLDVFYDRPSLLSVAAIVRSIQPNIILTHSLSDYMEDHQNVCRLVTTAAFSRSIPNFHTSPEQPPFAKWVRIYHAPPHGLRDALNTRFEPDFLIDIDSTLQKKAQMLACHTSQQEWLASTQGINAYIAEMEEMSREMGQLGHGLFHAEAWRRHSHLGFCPADYDPLPSLLQPFLKNLKN